MPAKSDIIKGVIRFAAVWASFFAFMLTKTSASTLRDLELAVLPALIMAIEKTFVGI